MIVFYMGSNLVEREGDKRREGKREERRG